MRGDRSFAYDLIVRCGPVSSRVALLLRSAEGKPPSTRFVYNTLHLVLRLGAWKEFYDQTRLAKSYAALYNAQLQVSEEASKDGQYQGGKLVYPRA